MLEPGSHLTRIVTRWPTVHLVVSTEMLGLPEGVVRGACPDGDAEQAVNPMAMGATKSNELAEVGRLAT